MDKMFNKNYVLRMLDLLGTEGCRDIEKIFAGVGSQYEDKEVQEKLVSILKKLVENDTLTAQNAERLIRKHFPKLIKKPKRPPITFTGPFPGQDPKMIIDFSRMGKDWIDKYTKALPIEREEMTRPHLNE
jgi:hypothetical protein